MNARRIAWGCIVCAVFSAPVSALEPIKIGLVAESTGANAETGRYQVYGATLAAEEINNAGGVLGRPLEIKVEDSQSTNSGSALAFSRLMDERGLIAVVGPVRSTQILAMMPSILTAGIPTMIGGTDYTLTHAGNPWVFRVRPHDGYSTKAVVDFGVNTLKRKKWAIVYTTDTFGIGGKNGLLEALQASDIAPVIVQSININAPDFTPVVQAIKQSGADILATYIPRANDQALLAKELRQQGVAISWIGSASIATGTAVREGGEALHGTYAASNFVPDSSPQAQEFNKKYQEKFAIAADHYSAWVYDAVHLLALAAKNANSTKPDAIRKAMLSIKGHKGAQGAYSYDQHGDGLHGYSIVKNERGKIVFVKYIAFQFQQ
jgi:branched-chain amino acid transport system substrate-binding protein